MLEIDVCAPSGLDARTHGGVDRGAQGSVGVDGQPVEDEAVAEGQEGLRRRIRMLRAQPRQQSPRPFFEPTALCAQRGLDDRVAGHLQEQRVPGASAIGVRSGEVGEHAAYGVDDLVACGRGGGGVGEERLFFLGDPFDDSGDERRACAEVVGGRPGGKARFGVDARVCQRTDSAAADESDGSAQ